MSNQVERLKWHIQKVMPAIYDDSLSYYELLSKVLYKLNEVIEQSNEYFGQNLDDIVSSLFVEMTANGEFDEIIKSTVFTDFNNQLENNTQAVTNLENRLIEDEINLVGLTDIVTGVNDELSRLIEEEGRIKGTTIYVESFPRLEGENEDGQRINRAIESSSVGSKIVFSNKEYVIATPIILKSNRNYEGQGWQTIIKMKAGANLQNMIQTEDNYEMFENIEFKNMSIDGNKTNNTSGVGLYFRSLAVSTIENIKIENCAGTGMFFDGFQDIQGSTFHIRNCNIEGNSGYGVYVGVYNQDVHIYGGDIGLNQYGNIWIGAPSSSIRNATCWAAQINYSGIYVHPNAIALQIMNCQVEGNAGHGIEVYADHVLIVGCKIYDNANVGSNYGKFDGIYVGVVKNVSILSNLIFSGLYDVTGYYRAGITLENGHVTANVFANSIKYMGNGVINDSIPSVQGLASGDYTDYSWGSQSLVQ